MHWLSGFSSKMTYITSAHISLAKARRELDLTLRRWEVEWAMGQKRNGTLGATVTATTVVEPQFEPRPSEPPAHVLCSYFLLLFAN